MTVFTLKNCLAYYIVAANLKVSWSQSVDFRFYSYNASFEVHRLERFSKVEENIFDFKTH
jgi:hypothetical protein